MPYYMGDFYRGDFYRGDPFWGTVLGLGKKLFGAVTGGLVRRPGGAVAVGPTTTGIVRKVGGAIERTVMGHPVLSAAGAAGAVGAMAGAFGERAAMGGMAPKGFHPCKHPGKCKNALVRNRHMRVTNPRALRRSLRRIGGFARVARRVLHFTHPRAARGKARFKFPRRKK